MSKLVSWLLVVLFILFALVQYNDPDWYLWGTVYGLVAVFLIWQKKLPDVLPKIYLLLLLLWFLFMIPDLVHWIKTGTPSITGTMKAENPEVEIMREFFGLLLCILTMIYVVKKINNKPV